ncbi:homoserine dehydrogenase [Humisphaera borealis]|uniref:Homoserine dehydrogenase n=1 Tax=Humisphaera borealis TaxID=2807512 RepID=A0A7M2X531_9BACT|nr:homoserine dehydrogenase [Humisphaera borealis]QOV92151.1 homoserine dehydrogenase [Humisphaera borealis]
MTQTSIGICLLGCGVVGSGVVKLLREQRELLARRTNLAFDIRHVVVRDVAKHAAGEGNLPYTSNAAAAIDDPAVQIVIEVMGGRDPALAHIERALKLGKPVVTANKSLLAERGPELFSLARKHGSCIAFEASTGGGIPIIDAISRGLVANRIDALVGIVNGTCNVILTRMTRNGWSYHQALTEAQKLGFAEADPTLDVSGRDAAQKLALLSGLAFNARVAEKDIQIEGVADLQSADIKFAGDLGYVIKLLAIAERQPDGRLALRVHPTLVSKSDVLAEVSGPFNAISVYGHALGHALFYGRGAGQMPTASAVVADLVQTAIGVVPLAFKKLNIFPDAAEPAQILPANEITSRYYLRLSVKDQPGVMGAVSQVLGQHGISISAILQHEVAEDADGVPIVPIVITTHRAQEGAVRASLKQIDALSTVRAPSVCLRIIDQPKEFA